jgi:hypothetical protein
MTNIRFQAVRYDLPGFTNYYLRYEVSDPALANIEYRAKDIEYRTMTLKNLLAKIPYTADLYDALKRERPKTRYNLSQLEKALPAAVEQTRPFAEKAPKGKKIILFATLHYWVEQAVIVGLALRGMGHEVTIAYLPYGDWDKEINAFDLRRQDLYTRRVLKPLKGLVEVVSLLDSPERSVPQRSRRACLELVLSRKAVQQSGASTADFTKSVQSSAQPMEWLEKAIETASGYDVMYTYQVEDFDRDSDLYRLRVARNRQAALAALRLLKNPAPKRYSSRTVWSPNWAFSTRWRVILA